MTDIVCEGRRIRPPLSHRAIRRIDTLTATVIAKLTVLIQPVWQRRKIEQ
jgi:hypothetical protein